MHSKPEVRDHIESWVALREFYMYPTDICPKMKSRSQALAQHLPAEMLLLPIAEGRIAHERDSSRHVNTNVATIRAEFGGDGANVPHL